MRGTVCVTSSSLCRCGTAVAFKVYDMDSDGFISNGELFQTLKLMVGSNLKDSELQQIVDKSIQAGDKDGDGKLSFQEFCGVRIYLSVCLSVSFCLSLGLPSKPVVSGQVKQREFRDGGVDGAGEFGTFYA